MITLESINDFYEAQFREWPGLKASYDALMTAERRIMDMAGMNVGLQYNPQRRQSTEAAVDSSSLAKRPCFLCKTNRPKEQQSLKIIDGWDWLINPYPIFPVHFTIVSKAHEPQEEIPLDMVAAADAAPCLAFFYNGARSGASAPDHLHFQATLKDELPLLPIVERCHTADKSGIMLSTDFPADLPMKFWSLVVMPDPTGMQLLSILPKLYGFDATTGAPDPGMVNVIVWMDASRRLRVVVFPLKHHRPACYYAEEKDRCLVSPGAVDMAGLFILPRKEDFDRLDTEGIKDIYDQCGLTADELRNYRPAPL